MAENKKGFFYIPTGILILLLVVTIGSLFFEFYFFTNIENFETITVNGKEYSKGSEQYESAIKVAKNIIMTSGLITLAIFIDGRKCIRIPDKKRKIQFFLWPVYAMIADAINRMAIFISNYYVYFTHYPPPKLTPSPDAVIVITNYLPSYIMLFIEIILLILIIRRLVSSNQKKLAADS